MRILRLAPSRRRARQLALAAVTAAGVATLAPAAAVAVPGDRPASVEPPASRLDARISLRLDRALGGALAKTWSPGAIAGVWVGDRGWTAVRGVAHRAGGRVPRLSDHTRIGSVTKTFTGTLVLQLVDDGKLRLDDTIERWFPDLPGASGICRADRDPRARHRAAADRRAR